ncbi:MAG: hypothetical protein C5B48_12045 [Candidatus Rokuibacteriota bacterium]|nr:MAG: hypothetical protein C5B48_12045 [Candidatus Rokubacteria bacterium]
MYSDPMIAGRRFAASVYSSAWSRRLVPSVLAETLIDACVFGIARLRPDVFADWLSFYRELLAHTSQAGHEHEIAWRGVAEYLHHHEIFWRPWLMKRGEIEGLEHLRRARATDRGVVAVYPHFGMHYAQHPILRRHGIAVWAVAARRPDSELLGGAETRFIMRARKYLDALGHGRVITPRAENRDGIGAFARALETLLAGRMVTIAFDQHGRTQTAFLGRTLQLASGPSRLTTAADAVALPFVIRRRGYRPVLRFMQPIDARHFDGNAEALQRAIAAVFEQVVLEQPEAVWPMFAEDGVPLMIRGPAVAPCRSTGLSARTAASDGPPVP